MKSPWTGRGLSNLMKWEIECQRGKRSFWEKCQTEVPSLSTLPAWPGCSQSFFCLICSQLTIIVSDWPLIGQLRRDQCKPGNRVHPLFRMRAYGILSSQRKIRPLEYGCQKHVHVNVKLSYLIPVPSSEKRKLCIIYSWMQSEMGFCQCCKDAKLNGLF